MFTVAAGLRAAAIRLATPLAAAGGSAAYRSRPYGVHTPCHRCGLSTTFPKPRSHPTSFFHSARGPSSPSGLLPIKSGFPGAARTSAVPAAQRSPSGEAHPGKFVWAGLLQGRLRPQRGNSIPAYSRRPPSRLETGQRVTYTVFSNGNHPVAGLRQRSPSAATRAARWINYIAVADIASTLSNATKAGAEVRAPAREFPRLGSQAIITDESWSPSPAFCGRSSGDSADNEPAPGDWNWFHLLTKNPHAAADFYRRASGEPRQVSRALAQGRACVTLMTLSR